MLRARTSNRYLINLNSDETELSVDTILLPTLKYGALLLYGFLSSALEGGKAVCVFIS